MPYRPTDPRTHRPTDPQTYRRHFLATSASLVGATFCQPCSRCWAAASWIDQQWVGPFHCHADFSLVPYKGLFNQLERLQFDLVRSLGIDPAQGPIDLYLFRDKQSYRDFFKQHLPKVPYRRALFVKSEGGARVFAYQHPEFSIDVRHECTHALLHAALEMVPLWLDEGLAEYFEVSEDKRPFDHPHLTAVKWNMRLGIVVPVASLEKKQSLAEMRRMEYRFSWAWVHFMLHGPPQAHRALIRFLADIQVARPPGQLSERLARRISHLDRRMVEHFKGWRR